MVLATSSDIFPTERGFLNLTYAYRKTIKVVNSAYTIAGDRWGFIVLNMCAHVCLGRLQHIVKCMFSFILHILILDKSA